MKKKYTKYNSCDCGNKKIKESKLCLECYRKKMSKDRKGKEPWNKNRKFTEKEMKYWKKQESPLICRICKLKANKNNKHLFVKNKGNRKDGYIKMCKECYKEYRKFHGGVRSNESIEKGRKRGREYYNKHKKKVIQQVNEWRKNNPNFKEKASERTKKQVMYKRKAIKLDSNPRIGVCKLCGRSIKNNEIKVTQIHHFKYAYETKEVLFEPLLVLDNAIEVCYPCHKLYTAFFYIVNTDIEKLKKALRLLPKEQQEIIKQMIENESNRN